MLNIWIKGIVRVAETFSSSGLVVRNLILSMLELGIKVIVRVVENFSNSESDSDQPVVTRLR